MTKRSVFLFIKLIICILAFSCTKEKDPVPNQTTTNAEFKNGVWVINEGNFGGGNASLDFYSKISGKAGNNEFENVNKRPLGDVLQSVYLHEGKYYIVVNNSQKIEIAEAGSLKASGAIYGFTSPRYFLPLNADKAYVTDLYANGIWIVDLKQNLVKSKIDASGWTEQMVLFDKKLFVTQVKRNKVLIIDTETDKLLDSIAVGEEPQCIKQDKEGKLWVLCNAYKKSQPASLHRIDPQTKQVIKTYTFPDQSHSPSRLCFNSENDVLFYLDKGVRKMNINDMNLPAAPFISEKKGNFYGLGIDTRDNILYVADALDYVQPGFVFRFKDNATPLDSFKTGINPADFYFVN